MYSKTKFAINIKALYIGCILLSLYFFTRVYNYLFEEIGVILMLLMWVTAGMLLFMAIIKLCSFKNIFYDPLLNACVLFWIWTVISTILNMTGITSFINDFVTLSFGFIFLLFFSYCTRDLGDKDIEFVKKFSAFFLIFVSIVYISWIVSGGDVTVSGALNSVYYVLLLLPIVFIQKNKLLIALEIVALFASVLLSGKRTAFIVLIAALILPIVLSLKKGEGKKGRQVLLLILIIALLFITYNYLSSVFDITLFERFEDIGEDEGSGRLTIYKEVIEGFGNSSFLEKLFGHGFNGVANDGVVMFRPDWATSVSATSAHNDFLEVIYDYGIIGLLFYIVIIVKLIKNAVALRKINMDYFKMYVSAIVTFLLMSMFSHLIIYPTYVAFLWMFFSLGSSKLIKKGCKDEDIAH